MAEAAEGGGLPREDDQVPIDVDQGLDPAGEVEQLDGGVPVVVSYGGVRWVGGGPVAEGAVG